MQHLNKVKNMWRNICVKNNSSWRGKSLRWKNFLRKNK